VGLYFLDRKELNAQVIYILNLFERVKFLFGIDCIEICIIFECFGERFVVSIVNLLLFLSPRGKKSIIFVNGLTVIILYV
jgi:hypothetical protein